MIHGYRVVTLFKCINCNQLLVSKSITRLIPPSNLPGRGGVAVCTRRKPTTRFCGLVVAGASV